MITLLLVLHLIVTLALIAVVLIQRSEGGGLGIGSSQGMGTFMTGRGTANLLTRSTAVLAGLFMLLSLALAIANKGSAAGGGHDILAHPPLPSLPTPTNNTAPAPSVPAPTQGKMLPSTPTVPPQGTPHK